MGRRGTAGAPDPANNDFFGRAVALSGDTAVVAAPDKDDAGLQDVGALYVFVRAGGAWSLEAKVLAATPGAYESLGLSLDLDGDTLAAGSSDNQGAPSDVAGRARVFTRSAGAWSEEAELLSPELVVGEGFGECVAVDGDTLLVGAIGNDAGGVLNAGAVYAFVRAAGTWSLQQKLVAADGELADFLGNALSIDGDRALVGAQAAGKFGPGVGGAAYLFERAGAQWSQVAVLHAPVPANESYGSGVALDGNTVAVGARRNDLAGIKDAGAVFVERLMQCPFTQPGSEVVRAGTPPNPLGLVAGLTGPPAIGKTWVPATDVDFVPQSARDFLAIATAPAELPTVAGTLLLAPDRIIAVLTEPGAAVWPNDVLFAVPVPADCALVGATFHAQAMALENWSFDLILSNALDLVVGTE